MARTSLFAVFLGDYVFHGSPLPTDRPRFPPRHRSRSDRRLSAPSDICKPKVPLG